MTETQGIVLATQHNKQLGSVGETIVTTELLKRGWVVSTPEGDYAPYDRIATKDTFTHKIQVKSATHNINGTYKWTLKGGQKKQKEHSLDDISYYIFVAVPVMLFLIVPYDMIKGLQSVSIPSDPKKNKNLKYSMYLNAWGLMENKGYKDTL